MTTKIKKNRVTMLQIKIVNVSRDRFLDIFKELVLQIKIQNSTQSEFSYAFLLKVREKYSDYICFEGQGKEEDEWKRSRWDCRIVKKGDKLKDELFYNLYKDSNINTTTVGISNLPKEEDIDIISIQIQIKKTDKDILLSIFENIVKELYCYNLSEYKKSWSTYLWGQCFSNIQSKYRYDGDKHLIMFGYTKTMMRKDDKEVIKHCMNGR